VSPIDKFVNPLTLTLNKKQKMKIMGRVARLILLVVVSVCVVFCVLCCLQNNPVFSSVTYLIISKMKIMSYVFRRVSSLPEKKDTVVCLLGARFWRLRPEKKDTVVCLVGCAVVLCQFLVLAGNWQFFCCGRKLLLRPEKKEDTVVCLAGARSLLRPEKKDTVVCLLGARFWRF